MMTFNLRLRTLNSIVFLYAMIMTWGCNTGVQPSMKQYEKDTTICASQPDKKEYCQKYYQSIDMWALYTKINDTVSGNLLQVYNSKNIIRLMHYEKNLPHGKSYIYSGPNLKLIDYFENGKKILTSEDLRATVEYFVTDHNKKKKKYIIDSTSDSVNIISYSFNNGKRLIGELIYIHNQISELSSYIQLHIPDTVNYGDEFTIEFNHHFQLSEKSWIIFGEFDDDLNFIKPEEPDTITIHKGKPYFHKMTATKPGVNNISGVVIGFSDTTHSEPVPFYDMYYVKKAE